MIKEKIKKDLLKGKACETKVRLLNSAMMPVEGRYNCFRIDFAEFCYRLKEAYKKGNLVSYIGYPQNVELIKKWTGVNVELNRTQCELNSGDELLVMRLKYRVSNPTDKGKEVNVTDFEFFYIIFESF